MTQQGTETTAMLARILALWSCVAVTLPQGWCCLVLSCRPAEVEVRAITPPACPCCQGEGSVPSPQPPAPRQPLPCCVRQDVAKGGSPEMSGDFLPAFVGLTPILSHAGDVETVGTGFPPSCPRLLHLLHCVWLC
jgi:hypothetical protein